MGGPGSGRKKGSKNRYARGKMGKSAQGERMISINRISAKRMANTIPIGKKGKVPKGYHVLSVDGRTAIVRWEKD